MKTLYPEIEPFTVHNIQVDDIHKIYVEQCGNPEGLPVIFLHGGPGFGCSVNDRRYFDPEIYHIVIFDQRGSGRSTPAGCLENNTAHHSVADIEHIRAELNIDKWVVFGGSWGTMLGMLYAQTHPDKVLGLVLRGTFLGRQSDIAWYPFPDEQGVHRFFPEQWERFIADIPVEERNDLLTAFHKRICGSDMVEKYSASEAFVNWAGFISTYLLPEASGSQVFDIGMLVEKGAAAVCIHYFKKGFFIEDGQLFDNASLLPDVPIKFVHGRGDMNCLLSAVWELHRSLPHSELIIVEKTGHYIGEPGMIDALIAATDEMASRFGREL